MVNVFICRCSHNFVLFSALCSFNLTYCIPKVYSIENPQCGVTINDALFVYNLECAIEKVMKYKNSTDIKDNKKMIKAMLEVKNLIERQTGINIDINNFLEQTEKSLKKDGKRAPNEFKALKKQIKKIDKRISKKVAYIDQKMNFEEVKLNKNEEEIFLRQMAKKTDEDEENSLEFCVPAQLTFGVTLCLCGFFLMRVPLPICSDWGGKLVMAGFMAAGNAICNKVEDNKKEEVEKNKNN